jgi:CheY-like chemotaxis protein
VQKRVLVVEDDADLNGALCAILTERGYEVASAQDGQDACAAVLERGFRPHAILLDLHMPVMDGLEFLQRQAEEPLLADVRVIVLSARAAVLEEKGVHTFAVVPKPARMERLLDAIERACEGSAPPLARVS